ncbi:MAG: biopolymer transporter ExbD [Porticoccus sp.]|nr:biopolymer transporter ExbD [Porticoccus sp.]MBQ0808172.1 biopolymer transporter ExbD [Porticoccus sp.]MDX2350348.1 biopolymer transporter ExbD [Porticoccus sp.]
MKFRRQKKVDDNVNLTPLIDVVFLLLIFFMVSTTFTKESHLILDLPEADGEVVEAPVDGIEILIGKNGDYTINGKQLINRQLKTLMRSLEDVSLGNSELPLTITADANTSHQSVVTAMDAAGKMGFIHLKITTKQPDEES